MSNNDFKGFTLAEVLITLGVIGVVAAMTLPVRIANHKKDVTATKMKKFYTTMSQAVNLSRSDYGDVADWTVENYEGRNPDVAREYYNKYLGKYINASDVKNTADGVMVSLSDGSAFALYSPDYTEFSAHIIYCLTQKGCNDFVKENNNKVYGRSFDGKNTFLFLISRETNKFETYFIQKKFEDDWGDDVKDRDTLKDSSLGVGYGCSKRYKAYCAALIEYDGWKIEKDYPVKF